MLATKFESPSNIGDKSNIRAICIKVILSAIPGKTFGASVGINIYPMTATMKIVIEKKENMVLMNFAASSFDFSSRDVMNGTNTEIETIDATVAKIKSGISNAE